MVKGSRWEELVGDRRIHQYKWEFLRRNEEYQSDYTTFEERFAGWIQMYEGWIPPGFVKEDDPEEWSFFQSQVEPAVWKITERWYIRDPTDPTRSYLEALPFFFSEAQVRKKGDEEDLESHEPPTWDYFSHILGDAPNTPKGLRFIQAPIDITEPNERIFAHLAVRIEIARARYKVHIGPLPDSRRRPRTRLEEYDSYLKVWDLRKQDLTFEQIAFRLFPLEMENVAFRSAVTKRVRSQFQRAQKLIDGDYRQIEA